MSDTPETDHQPIIYAINDNGYQVPCVDIEYARKLERERDEAREIIRMAKAKFCEEGSDGNIASEMFSILSGAK